jgi:hypothetical protein
VDNAARYLQLTLLGREAFVGSVAPAALVRRRKALNAPGRPTRTTAMEAFDHETTTLLGGEAYRLGSAGGESQELEIYPLAKKPGASFADMITVGRTANNDIVLNDVTVSRFHAFFREREGSWVVCDAGSKNGTTVDGHALEARKERPIESGTVVRIGDIETRFFSAEELFVILTA